MYNYIILSSSLFGSVYLFSKSLELINRSHLENKQMIHNLILINGLTFMLSGSIFLYSFNLYKFDTFLQVIKYLKVRNFFTKGSFVL